MDPSRRVNEYEGRDNPPRRRSADERLEVDNEANPIDDVNNNNPRRDLNSNTPSPDSQVVTSTTPEDELSPEIDDSRGSSEVTPPLSVESPNLEDDLPPADSPESREVTSTSLNSAINPPLLLQEIAGMSIDESGLNVQRNAREIPSSSGQIRSSINEPSGSRHDQNPNISVQNPTVGGERCNAATEEAPISVASRRLLNNPTEPRPPDQRQQTASSLQGRPTSLGVREHLITTPQQNIVSTIPLTRPQRPISIETPSSVQRMATHVTTSSNRPPMPVTTSVTNPPTYASVQVQSSIRPRPITSSSANPQSSSFPTSPNVSAKQPVQSHSTRPPGFEPSSSKPKTTLVSSNTPQSPVPFSSKLPSTIVPTTSTIPFNPAAFSISPVQSSTTVTSSISSNTPCSTNPAPSSSTMPPAFESSSSTMAPSSLRPSALAPSSTTRSPAPDSSMRHPAPDTSIPDSTSSMCSKQSTSSNTPLVSCSDGQKKVVTTSTKSSEYAHASTTPLQIPPLSPHSTRSLLAEGSKETLKNINVPIVTINPPDNSSESPESLTKSPVKKSPTKRQADTPTQGTSDGSNTDNNSSPAKRQRPEKSPVKKSPTKRQADTPTQGTSDGSSNTDYTLSPAKMPKIAIEVGEGSKQSEKDDSSKSAAEDKCDEMDDDSDSEIPSTEKKDDPK